MLNKLKTIAKDLLAVGFIRSVYESCTAGVLEVFASNRFMATIYSIPTLLTFNREQFAVLRGRRQYYRNLRKSRVSHVELRRNIHRLEKAMVMRPRKPVFAADYITETVDFYEHALLQYTTNPKSMDDSEIQWAFNVLGGYFLAITGVNQTIENAKARFGSMPEPKLRNSQTMAPYEQAGATKSKVEYDDLLDLAMQRRSVRWFLPKKVPRSLVDKALLVARQSPTACNRMPYEYRIFDDPKLVAKIAKIPFGAAGYNHNIQTLVVVVGKQSSYFSPRDRHLIYIDASLANMAFMFALETLGLSSSPINWPDFEPLEQKMQKALKLGYDDRVVMLMAVGYPNPKGMVAFSQKKNLDTIRSYNEIGPKE